MFGTIGELCDVATGGTPSRRRGDFWGGDIPWMSSGEIHQGRVTQTRETITDAGFAASNARWIPEGAVMLALNGQGKTRGKAAILERRMTCNQSLAAILPRDNKLVPDYLLHYLSAKYAAIRRLTGHGGRNGLNLRHVRSILVAYPSLSEQRKIAAILSSVDDAIEKTQAVIDQVQVVKRGLMQELLTRGLPGRHTRFKQTEIGEIPAEWVVSRIGELGQSERPAVKAGPFGSSLKKSYYTSDGYRVYGQEQVLGGDLAVGDYYIDAVRFQSLKSCEIRTGDILVSLVGTFGKALVVPADAEPGIINPRLLRVSLDSSLVLPEFFCYWLQASDTQRLLADAAQGGTMGVLNAGIVKNLSLGRPSFAEQMEIVETLDAVEGRLDSERAKLASAGELKSSLMSVLLTGELRVTPDTEAA